MSPKPLHVDTLVIGGGQAGLATGYHLARRNVPFLVVDAGHRIGDSWRNRWDSLRLFTPARYSSLDGLPFPAPADYCPTKDEMADYLERYAIHFDLPVRLGFEVDRLARRGNGFVVASGDRVIEAGNVVVAMGNEQKPRIPAFASELDPTITQLHSSSYRRPSQIPPGAVLIVGAGNSGAEIALDLAREHKVWLSGRHPGHVPGDIDSFVGRKIASRFVNGVLFHHILRMSNPLGRKAYRKLRGHGKPLIRTKPNDLLRSGVETVGRTAGTRQGMPLLDDGRTLDVQCVVWATGSRPGFTWIDRDILAGDEPAHDRGVVGEVPGLYFVGLDFLHALSSAQVRGVSRDAAHVATAVAARARAAKSPTASGVS
ncbi:MAG: NAD(P)/FAD-dependent oxidoreductase [Acidimicrobiia bacterium]